MFDKFFNYENIIYYNENFLWNINYIMIHQTLDLEIDYIPKNIYNMMCALWNISWIMI